MTRTTCDVALGNAGPRRGRGLDEVQAKAFRPAAITLKRRPVPMLAPPMPSLDRLAIHTHVQDIGNA